MLGYRQIRAVSEGSFPLTVAGNLKTEQRRRCGEVRQDQESTDKGGERGSGCFTRCNQEEIRKRELEGGGGGSVYVGNSNVTGTTDRSIIVQVTK